MGFVGPDSSGKMPGLLVIHESPAANQESIRTHGWLIGIPKGTECSNATLNGTYHSLSQTLFMQGEESSDVVGNDTMVSAATSRYSQQLTNGLLSMASVHTNRADLELNAGSPTLELVKSSAGRDNSLVNQLTVADDCSFVFDDSTLPSHHGASQGFVSPDGRIMVLGTLDSPRSTRTSVDAYLQLVIGVRE